MLTGWGALAGGVPPGHRLGPGFDLLLVAHVACVIVGLGAIAVSGVQAVRVRRVAHGTPVPPALLRYFGPGPNWVGRTLFGVPIFGFALLGASGGSFRLGDDWVVLGLVLWGVAALCAEGLLWPAERRVQRALAEPAGPAAPDWRRAAGRIGAVSGLLVAVLLTATVLMVAQP
ncbi:MAG TPA: hypothetical protein VN781_07145 [Acidimicrobiales bacterium]|nr:hypothetical protein [Acidimicrobiales bacterium]